MRTRKIGSLSASVIGLGCNNFGGRLDEATTRNVVDAALANGVSFFDTADTYGGTDSESFLGRVLEGRRDKVVLATKFGSKLSEQLPGGARPEYLKRAVVDSLRRLRTDHIDLYQLHRPDAAVPIADTLGALSDLVAEGSVLEIGCSNFDRAQLEEAEAVAANGGARFVSVQNEYSLLQREAESEVLPSCKRLGIAFLPYFPLFSGLLTGKYRHGLPRPEGTRISGNPRWEAHLTDANLDTIERLAEYADGHGRTVLDLAFAWLLARPEVASVIAGASNVEQIAANAAAASWELSQDQVNEVNALL